LTQLKGCLGSVQKVDNLLFDALCTYLVDLSLSGNTILVSVTYDDNPVTTVSIMDDKGNTYIAGPAAHDTTNGRWVALFYVPTAIVGTRNITVKWSGSVAHMSAMTSQWYNIGTVDGSAASSGPNGSTTVSSGTVTPTIVDDFIYQYSCRTQTLAATGYAAGSQANISWNLVDGAADRLHGCVAQWGTYSSTSPINPTMPWATGSGYASVAIAFRSASGGTAPSGMRITAIQHESTANNTTGTFSFDVPASSTNNLLVIASQSGGPTPMRISGVSDSNGNTWANAGPANSCAISSPCSQTYYAAKANLSTNLTVAVNTTGTGDATFNFYIIAGASSSPFGTRVVAAVSSQTPGNINMLNITPGNANCLVIATIGVNFNTVGGLASPTGSCFDSNSYGGENISGPIPVDENNGWGHFYYSDNLARNWTWTLWDPTIAAGQTAGEADSFYAASSVAVVQPPTGLTATVR